MASSGDKEDSFDIDTKVQMSGILSKRPFGHRSTKWQRRFFIIKEGFILYYPEAEKKAFEKSHHFNIHPKGVIPLGGCAVKALDDQVEKTKFPMIVEHKDFKGNIVLASDSLEEREGWMKMISTSGRVTWKNAQLGDAMITQLEAQSRRMADQQQKITGQLQEEASALLAEKGKKDELEKLAAELATEKKAIEDQLEKFQEDKEVTEGELKGTLETLQQLKHEKDDITLSLQSLQNRFVVLSQKQELTTAQLEERNSLAKQLEEEKMKLLNQTSSLTDTLETVQSAKEKLGEEKKKAEELLLKEAQEKKQIEQEKKRQSLVVLEKEEMIKQVEQEKAEKEKAYLKEKKQRVATEKRLRLAEDSLKRVDRALKESGIHLDLQLETDVKNLKQFFEEIVEEVRLEAEKPQIMKEALTARVQYSRKSAALSDEEVSTALQPPESTTGAKPPPPQPRPRPRKASAEPEQSPPPLKEVAEPIPEAGGKKEANDDASHEEQ
eukprot:m.218008 g.218008  ORF g.218008 m.218008 type:complete len:495 (+) comp39887_c0_seq9:206-1690(+)